MPTTITSYVTVVANTKARATDVNINFNNHRGSLVPINTDTASASDNTHDLGTTEHRWRTGNIVNILSTTITANTIKMLAATTTGDFTLEINAATAAQADIKFGAATSASFVPSGLTRRSITGWTTGSGDEGHFRRSSASTENFNIDTSGSITMGVTPIPLIRRGRPVMVGMMSDSGFAELNCDTTTSFIGCKLEFHSTDGTVAAINFNFNASSDNVNTNGAITYPLSSLWAWDLSQIGNSAVTTTSYHMRIVGTTANTATAFFRISNAQLFAVEIN